VIVLVGGGGEATPALPKKEGGGVNVVFLNPEEGRGVAESALNEQYNPAVVAIRGMLDAMDRSVFSGYEEEQVEELCIALAVADAVCFVAADTGEFHAADFHLACFARAYGVQVFVMGGSPILSNLFARPVASAEELVSECERLAGMTREEREGDLDERISAWYAQEEEE
jgi:hypothetical protein